MSDNLIKSQSMVSLQLSSRQDLFQKSADRPRRNRKNRYKVPSIEELGATLT